MKKLISLTLCLLILVGATGCSFARYNITYDDASFFIETIDSAKPGDVIKLRTLNSEKAYFYTNGVALSPKHKDETYTTYEFIMPPHDVHITHVMEEEPMNTPISIPASMQCLRISYSTEFAFTGKYMIVRNMEEASALFAGFSLAYPDKVETYPENFFENHILVAYVQHEGSGSVSHSLKKVFNEEGMTKIVITRHVPYIGTCDMASWLCLISIDKTMLSDPLVLQILTEQEDM